MGDKRVGAGREWVLWDSGSDHWFCFVGPGEFHDIIDITLNVFESTHKGRVRWTWMIEAVVAHTTHTFEIAATSEKFESWSDAAEGANKWWIQNRHTTVPVILGESAKAMKSLSLFLMAWEDEYRE